MTGPEHYRYAEELLRNVARTEGYDTPVSRECLAAAQVHATLALAAATALDATVDLPVGYAGAQQWAGIAAPQAVAQ